MRWQEARGLNVSDGGKTLRPRKADRLHKLEKRRKKILLWSPKKENSTSNTLILDFWAPDHKTKICAVFRHQICGQCYSINRRLKHLCKTGGARPSSRAVNPSFLSFTEMGRGVAEPNILKNPKGIKKRFKPNIQWRHHLALRWKRVGYSHLQGLPLSKKFYFNPLTTAW